MSRMKPSWKANEKGSCRGRGEARGNKSMNGRFETGSRGKMNMVRRKTIDDKIYVSNGHKSLCTRRFKLSINKSYLHKNDAT